jgi:antirestriction protein ArdC
MAEIIIRHSGADVRHGGARAFYSPANDCIQLPDRTAFVDATRYYQVALHELTHWTGAESRCNRPLLGRQHIESYAFEELVAELGSAFLTDHCGLPGVLHHASYVESWLQALRNDKRLIFSAASQAQRAADYLLPPQAEDAVAMPVDTEQELAA